MTNMFKKVIAGLMAVASLTTGVVGIGANAIEIDTPVVLENIERYQGPMGYVSFGTNATAGIYCDSRQVNALTERTTSTYELYVGIENSFNGTVNSPTSVQAFNNTGAYLNTTGSNITKVGTYHYYKTSSNADKVATNLERSCS